MKRPPNSNAEFSGDFPYFRAAFPTFFFADRPVQSSRQQSAALAEHSAARDAKLTENNRALLVVIFSHSGRALPARRRHYPGGRHHLRKNRTPETENLSGGLISGLGPAKK